MENEPKKATFAPFEGGRPYPERKSVAHMGRMVRLVARQQGYNATTLAPLLNMSPGSVSKVFRRPFLHSTLLMRISQKLNYDFFAHLCRCPKEPPPDTSTLEKHIAELQKENKTLKEQLGYMERIVNLLEKGK